MTETARDTNVCAQGSSRHVTIPVVILIVIRLQCQNRNLSKRYLLEWWIR